MMQIKMQLTGIWQVSLKMVKNKAGKVVRLFNNLIVLASKLVLFKLQVINYIQYFVNFSIKSTACLVRARALALSGKYNKKVNILVNLIIKQELKQNLLILIER